MDDLLFSISVNFRGSAGFGQESLHSLPGNVGTQDVNDVQVWIQDSGSVFYEPLEVTQTRIMIFNPLVLCTEP